ncbi:MAG: redoxin domain-containing protein [Dysgonamonadaceae bacterium]|jgi:hypothetical protein|nr:redoxin domain-containing protein [Dysgonamonadaceae bacterium]
MKNFLLYFTTIVLFLLFSCTKAIKHTDEISLIIAEWVGKEIHFPSNVPCYFWGKNEKDTTFSLCAYSFQNQYKVLMFVDSSGCSDCRLQLLEWKHLITESNKRFHEKLKFLFYIQPKDINEILYLINRDRFNYPVFLDLDGKITQLNHFSSNTVYQCFLLDKHNKVLAIGNPVLNPKIWELYKDIIVKDKKE